MKSRMFAAAIATLLMAAMFYGIRAQAGSGRLKPGIDFSGPHFNLNVHGVPDDTDKFKNDTIGSGRHSIFVPLSSIDPQSGLPFNITMWFAFSQTLNWTVVDADATGEGHNASIILPAYMYIDTNADGIEDTKMKVAYYLVYAVGLGKPSDTSQVLIFPQVAYNASWAAYQFYEDALVVPGHRKGGKGGTGQPVWVNATNVFFVDVTFWNGTTNIYYVNQWVFDVPGLEGYWWNLQNDGTKLMQLRFYPVFKA